MSEYLTNEKILKTIGVELGEEFKIQSRKYSRKYKITKGDRSGVLILRRYNHTESLSADRAFEKIKEELAKYDKPRQDA